ncbi:hypothetical protein [Acuticoccus sediminis]|uniref:hypothetical protein n=1 Tax=Acuticoccus sediminis TaxID=2184697 RepID=UPI001CFE57A9|nr:hypothetical protein [Acuticoccus sediminis]
MTDDDAQTLSQRVDAIHSDHIELKARVVGIDERLSGYIESRSKQIEEEEERRDEERADRKAMWFWAKIAGGVASVVLTVIVGSLATSTVAIIRGLTKIDQHDREIAKNSANVEVMRQVLGDMRPDVATIKAEVRSTGERVRRIEAQQDRQ